MKSKLKIISTLLVLMCATFVSEAKADKAKSKHIVTNQEIEEEWLSDRARPIPSISTPSTSIRMTLRDSVVGCADLELEKTAIEFINKATPAQLESFILDSSARALCPFFWKESKAIILFEAKANKMTCIVSWQNQGTSEHPCHWIPTEYVSTKN